MGNLSITAANVVSNSTAIVDYRGVAGEAFTAGMCIYKKSSDGLYYKAQSDGTTAEAAAVGVALNSALGVGQPVVVGSGLITIGATTRQGAVYVVSQTAGLICEIDDLSVSNKVTILGVGASATQINFNVNATGYVVGT